MYRVVQTNDQLPTIEQGGELSWREAKKLLRAWYLEQARELRNITEISYFAAKNMSVDELIAAQHEAGV